MKNLLTPILFLLSFIGIAQNEGTFIINENFNIPIFETADYEVIGSGWSYELFGPNLLDGTPCLRASSNGTIYVGWPALDMSGVDSISISFNHKGACCGSSAYRMLQVSIDSLTWWNYSEIPMPSSWSEYNSNVNWLLGGIDILYFRIKFNANTPAYLDNVKVVSYPSTPVVEYCDTLYTTINTVDTVTVNYCEYPIDINGNGFVDMVDLLNLISLMGCNLETGDCDGTPEVSFLDLMDPFEKTLVQPINLDRKIIKVIDMTGREVHPESKGILLFIYDDGSVEKKINKF